MPKNLSIITSCYRGEKYLNIFLDNIKKQTLFHDLEVVLVANDPTEVEKTMLRDFQRDFPENIVLLEVAREPISVSMNRAVSHANGEYIFNWDIDDLRTENSIELQYKTLSQNPDITLTYGDFEVVGVFGTLSGERVTSPEFERVLFTTGMHCGPFRAWKKSIHQKIGYFDEQLRSGADFDLMVRIAQVAEMKKTHGLLGYYLNANTGLSTGGQKSFFSLQAKELKVINLRYNILSKIDYFVPTSPYTIGSYLLGDIHIPIEKYGFALPRKANFIEYIKSLYFTLKYGFLRIAKYIYLSFKQK